MTRGRLRRRHYPNSSVPRAPSRSYSADQALMGHSRVDAAEADVDRGRPVGRLLSRTGVPQEWSSQSVGHQKPGDVGCVARRQREGKAQAVPTEQQGPAPGPPFIVSGRRLARLGRQRERPAGVCSAPRRASAVRSWSCDSIPSSSRDNSAMPGPRSRSIGTRTCSIALAMRTTSASALSPPSWHPWSVNADTKLTRRIGRRAERPAFRLKRSGACRDRTGDLRLAKPALSQLS